MAQDRQPLPSSDRIQTVDSPHPPHVSTSDSDAAENAHGANTLVDDVDHFDFESLLQEDLNKSRQYGQCKPLEA